MPWSRPKKGDPGQIGVVKMYAKYAGIPDQDYRHLLKQYTHCAATSSTDKRLNQRDYDVVMPVLEIRAHLANVNGAAVGQKPRRIRDWYYWRKRQPAPGQVSTRVMYRISELWQQLRPHLHDDQQTDHDWYLLAIAKHAVGHSVDSIAHLRTGEAAMVVEALKDRLRYAVRSA